MTVVQLIDKSNPFSQVVKRNVKRRWEDTGDEPGYPRVMVLVNDSNKVVRCLMQNANYVG